MAEKKKTSTYVVFNDNITIEFGNNNQFVVKNSKGNIAYLDHIEQVIRKMKKWEMDKELAEPQQIELSDYLALEKRVLNEILEFFEDGFKDLEDKAIQAAKKFDRKKRAE